VLKAPKMTLNQITENNFSSLVRAMDPSIYLLGRLRIVPYVKDKISFINRQDTDDYKINALLNALIEAPDDVQESVKNGLISALRSSGQDHVANIYRKESDKVPMSDEHYRTLKVNMKQLCKFTDPENGLLNELVSTEVISLTDAQVVRSMPGYNEMARKLIEMLTRKSDDAFAGFINAINVTGQAHVTYMLTGEGNSRPLKEEHRRRLLANPRDCLVNNIESETSGLITALMDKGVFSENDAQRVTNNVQFVTQYDRNELILNLIARKSQADFLNFISALNETKQTHVVVELIGQTVVAKIKSKCESEDPNGTVSGVEADLLEYMREMFHSKSNVVTQLNKILSDNGVTVSDVREGCIEVTFTCRNVESLKNFQDLYKSGTLESLLNEAFCPKFTDEGLESLKMEISDEQFAQCADTFARWIPMTSENRKALLSSEEWLMEKMIVSGDLLDKLSMCRRRRQAIESATTREQQVKTLVDVVSRQPDSAFTQLLNALNDTNQQEAAAVISGDSTSDTRCGVRELHKTCTDDAWTNVDRNVNSLVDLFRKAELGNNLGEDVGPILISVFMSLNNLRQTSSVPMSRPLIYEKLGRLLYTSGVFLTHHHQPVTSWHRPGEFFFLFKRCVTIDHLHCHSGHYRSALTRARISDENVQNGKCLIW